MPDESCRRCGSSLKNFLKCKHCNALFQEICTSCDTKTLPRIHVCNDVIIA